METGTAGERRGSAGRGWQRVQGRRRKMDRQQLEGLMDVEWGGEGMEK